MNDPANDTNRNTACNTDVRNLRYFDTDDKFRRFIIGNLFNDGIHGWWLLGTFGTLSIISIVFVFFAAFVDTDLLFDSTEYVTRVQECARLQSDTGLDCATLEQIAMLTKSEREIKKL